MQHIVTAARQILDAIPAHVTVVAAAKTRTPAEVQAVIQAGITHIGHNYVQEAETMVSLVNGQVTWHMIGHLQRNKVKAAIRLFDIIETVDSVRLAQEIDKRCAAVGKSMPVLIEVNSGQEENKTGVLPNDVEPLVRRISQLAHIRVQGLMTMGPAFGDPEDARPYFRATRQTFESLARLNLPSVDMHWLSMGMSNSYLVAIQEGANIVRIGTKLFGPRAPAA